MFIGKYTCIPIFNNIPSNLFPNRDHSLYLYIYLTIHFNNSNIHGLYTIIMPSKNPYNITNCQFY